MPSDLKGLCRPHVRGRRKDPRPGGGRFSFEPSILNGRRSIDLDTHRAEIRLDRRDARKQFAHDGWADKREDRIILWPRVPKR